MDVFDLDRKQLEFGMMRPRLAASNDGLKALGLGKALTRARRSECILSLNVARLSGFRPQRCR